MDSAESPFPTPRTRRRPLGILLISVGLLAALGMIPWFWHRAALDQEREEGLRLARLGRFAEAEELLRAADQRDPSHGEVLKALALGLMGGESWEQAEPFLLRWHALTPEDASPLKNLLNIRHRKARLALTAADRHQGKVQALEAGEKAVALDPDDADVAKEVIWLLIEVGRFEDADPLCRRLLARLATDSWAAYLLARIDHARGQTAEASALLEAILRQNPRFARALLLKGRMATEAGEHAQAIPWLRQALSIDPTLRGEGRHLLSLCLAQTQQREEAQRLQAEMQRDELDQLLKAAGTPDIPAVKVQKAELRMAAGDEEEGLRLVRSALEEDPGLAAAHRLLAGYYERTGQPERAREHRAQANK